jgi:hypothetical protein
LQGKTAEFLKDCWQCSQQAFDTDLLHGFGCMPQEGLSSVHVIEFGAKDEAA